MRRSSRKNLILITFVLLFLFINPAYQVYSSLSEALGRSITSVAAKAHNPDPLLIAIEMHVENQFDTSGEAKTLRRISSSAAQAGLPITFGLGQKFLTSFPGRRGLVAHVQAHGHVATLHVDLPDGSYLETVQTLQERVNILHDLNGDPSVASGSCNATGPAPGWREAAESVGIETIAGVILYCYKSLDPAGPYAAEYLLAESCLSQAECHQPVPLTDADRLWPWRTMQTGTWLQDDGAGTLIISSFPEIRFDCMGEGATSADCSSDSAVAAGDDAEGFVYQLELALLARGSQQGGVFYIPWSTNWLPDDAYTDAIFTELLAAIDAAGLSDDIMFVTLPEIATGH